MFLFFFSVFPPCSGLIKPKTQLHLQTSITISIPIFSFTKHFILLLHTEPHIRYLKETEKQAQVYIKNQTASTLLF